MKMDDIEFPCCYRLPDASGGLKTGMVVALNRSKSRFFTPNKIVAPEVCAHQASNNSLVEAEPFTQIDVRGLDLGITFIASQMKLEEAMPKIPEFTNSTLVMRATGANDD